MRRLRRRPLTAVMLGLGFVLAACGAGSTQEASVGQQTSTTQQNSKESPEPSTSSSAATTSTTSVETTSAPTSTTAVERSNNFPDATVLAVDSGESFNLRMLGDAGTPVAMWFYYPH